MEASINVNNPALVYNIQTGKINDYIILNISIIMLFLSKFIHAMYGLNFERILFMHTLFILLTYSYQRTPSNAQTVQTKHFHIYIIFI